LDVFADTKMQLTFRHTRSARPMVGIALAVAMLAVAIGAAGLAGWAPIMFSIVTVFLFAGPHNWLEARYFLTRLPARWGKLQSFFLVAFGGMFLLTGSNLLLTWLDWQLNWSDEVIQFTLAAWNTALIGWIVILIQMRMRTHPRRDWSWTLPAAFLVTAVNWLAPRYVGMALVYLHPLMALWLFDRELYRSRRSWRPAYHVCLLAIPALLGILWWKLRDAPALPVDSSLHDAITKHAGASVFVGISNHFLVAAHTFLEMVHYGIWILAMPLVGLASAPWRLGNVPMARRGEAWRLGVVGILLLGLMVMGLLWIGFRADYVTTRYVYFQIALLHVLAEVPFLLRAL
jgi:hypothetical protein